MHFDTWNKKLQVTTTGFYRDINNLIAYVGNRLINIDRQKDKGLELEAVVTPVDRFTIKASYTYVTGSIAQTRNGKDTSYYNLIRRPKNTLVATVGYQVTPAIYVAVSAQSLGKRNDLFFGPPTWVGTPVSLKAYTLLNLYAEYKIWDNKIRLFADAKNITDTKYTEVYGYATPGINVAGGFRINL